MTSLEPVRLPDPPWMGEAGTRRVMAALAAGGTAVRFVGGCVRDALLGRPVVDIDIATPDPPERAMRKLEDAGLRALPTGIDHGTVSALADGRRYEVTTLRRDVETDGRRARVAFTDDWRADAARRDFTFNAMSADPDGRVYDYFGGLADLRAGCVRFVGDPRARIDEDHLRLLRFWRFHAHYGRAAPRAAERAACRAAAPLLDRLSGERIREELLKLLAAPDPVPSVAAMAEDGVFAVLPFSTVAVGALAALIALEPVYDRDPLRRLAALMPADPQARTADAVAARLRLSRAQRARLLATAAATPLESRAALRAALHRAGQAAILDRVLLAAARAGVGPAAVADDLAEIAAWSAPRFPLTGADLLAAGVAPGPRLGRLLTTVEDWWVGRDFAPDRDACLAQAQLLMATSPAAAGS